MSVRGALPMGRINTIMRSSSEVENISKETLPMMVKGTELFIKLMTKEAFKIRKKLDYNSLAEVVNRDERYEFLRDIMPKKITYAQYKKLQKGSEKPEGKEEKTSSSSGSGSSEDEDSDSESNNSTNSQ